MKPAKQGYILRIDQDKIEGPKDTVIDAKNYEFAIVPVEISNFTKDTLKYMDMSCSWDGIFAINKRAVSINGWGCDNNFITFSTIAPQKSFTYNIPLLIQKGAFNNYYDFKMGMYLIKYNGGKGFRDFDHFFNSDKKSFQTCLIWSNKVTISK